jgi:hypothetical protein
MTDPPGARPRLALEGAAWPATAGDSGAAPGTPACDSGCYAGWIRSSGTATRLTPLKLKSSSTR